MQWTSNAVTSPHPSVPILVGTRETWSTWTGRTMDETAFGELEGVVGVVEIGGQARAALPAFEQGAFHLAVTDEEVVLVHWFGSSKRLAAHKKKLGDGSATEYLAGVLEVVDALVIGDAWTCGWRVDVPAKAKKEKRGEESLFVVPRAPGRYVVLEGRDENGEETGWLRILPGDPSRYAVRPAEEPKEKAPADIARDLVHGILTPKVAGKNLVATSAYDNVKQVVALGQAALLEQKMAELEATRPAYARWLGILMREAKGEDARPELTSLAEGWLAPATSTRSPNQQLSKTELLEAFSALAPNEALAALKTKIEGAPIPDVFIEEGDFF